MVGYSKNHTRDTYKLYNPETKRFIMSSYIKWAECKNKDPAETMKMFRNLNENDLVSSIEEVVQEYNTPTSDPEDPLHMHVIHDEGESARTNENIKSSQTRYLKKETGKDQSEYDFVQQALKKLDTAYNCTITKAHEPIIEGKYKVTGDTRVIPIDVENKEEDISRACNTSLSMDAGEPKTLKEEMSRPRRNLWKMSDISEVNNFLSRKAWILINRSTVKAKNSKPVPMKRLFKSK